MKKKVLSVVLAAAMVLSLAACTGKDSGNGGVTSNSTSTSSEVVDNKGGEEQPYQLSTLKMVVDGTLTANADNRQDAFEEQWEKAVSEKMGYPVDLVISQQDHSGYKDAVGRPFRRRPSRCYAYERRYVQAVSDHRPSLERG